MTYNDCRRPLVFKQVKTFWRPLIRLPPQTPGLDPPLFRIVFFSVIDKKVFPLTKKKLCHFGQNVWKYGLKNAFMASFNTTMTHMTEMFQWPKCLSYKWPNVSAKKKQIQKHVIYLEIQTRWRSWNAGRQRWFIGKVCQHRKKNRGWNCKLEIHCVTDLMSVTKMIAL